MSTFFRSAAMTLLSKTLQTLLYKYLSDVDVEGVALPSLYSAGEGHSGWGVRLSNVKLREGTKLRNLPGKLRRKKRKKETAKSESTKEVTKNDESEHHDDEPTSEKGAPSANADALESSTKETTASSGWFGGWYRRSYTQPIPEESSVEPRQPVRSSSLVTNCYRGGRTRQIDPLVGTLSDDEQDLSGSQEETRESRKAAHSDRNYEDGNGSVDPSRGDANPTDSATADEEEPPVILRLGKGGHIGVLDVRLVGGNIHVLVEDADITVEVISQLQTVMGEEEGGEKEPPTTEKPKVPDQKKEPETIEERVLAEIALARIFSAIPNLFLRDIRIRAIIRDEVCTDPEDVSEEIGPDDTILDFSIELLSVTDGEDFLANFRAAAHLDGDHSTGDGGEDTAGDYDEDYEETDHSLTDSDNQNEFSVRRIRTGRGPEGGLSLRIYTGKDMVNFGKECASPVWARQSWLTTTDYYTLRISGLDVEARTFLGESQKTVVTSHDYIYDDFNVNSMLFGGVDYIAPGPQPPLPPMVSPGNLMSDEEDQPWVLPGATEYVTDMNGIQRCGVSSSFHRVSRGLRPTVCDKEHLPCEYCADCWDSIPGTSKMNPLDASTPMPGFVLHMSTRDPLEVNLDRPTLETIALLLRAFKKGPPESPDLVSDQSEVGFKEEGSENGFEELADKSQRSTLSHFSHGSTRNNSEVPREKMSKQQSNFHRNYLSKSGSNSIASADIADAGIDSSYPPYMQPEKVQVLGVHISDVKFRIHVLCSDGRPDNRLSFCYWDMNAKCLTMDIQQSSATERPFRDVRIDVGYFTADELCGIEKKQLVSLGLRQREVDFDEITVETLMTREPDSMRPPWPSTAAALLDLPPPLETLLYEARERHACQLRYFKVSESKEEKTKTWGHANIWLGSTYANVPASIGSKVSEVIAEARAVVKGEVSIEEPPATGSRVSDDMLGDEHILAEEARVFYKLRFEGGRFRMDPTIDISLPLTTFVGERSSLSGIFVETALENAKIKFKKPSPEIAEHGLTLQQLAALPENVRLRLLLFIPDLKPLEIALGIKPEPNSFLRCRAVNKGIVKVSRKASKRMSKAARKGRHKADRPNHRQELMDQLMKLDDLDLENLLMHHQRNRHAYGKTTRK